jgi:hypothetical protein
VTVPELIFTKRVLTRNFFVNNSMNIRQTLKSHLVTVQWTDGEAGGITEGHGHYSGCLGLLGCDTASVA